MEQSPVVVILLCALCLLAPLPSGSELPKGLELPSRSGSDSELPMGSELASGLELPLWSEPPMRLEPPMESELPMGLGLPTESEPSVGFELPSELDLDLEIPKGAGLELPLGSEPPVGSELPSRLGSDSELPMGLELRLGSEPPIGSESSSGSGSDSDFPTGLELPSGSEFLSRSSSDSEFPMELEFPSGSGSDSELPTGLELPSGSEPPIGSESSSRSGLDSEFPMGLDLPLGSGSDLELPSGSDFLSRSSSDSEPPSGSKPPMGSKPPPGSGLDLPALSEPIPLGLKATVQVNSTPCSVTCGLGVREEQLCELSPAGERWNCSRVRSRCLSAWICGLQHLRVPEGKPVQLTCLSPDAAGLEGPDFGYFWRFARGLITTNELLFEPFRNPSPSLSFSPALESHSGTYRCDVQVLSSFQLVKRIYFGLRVIPGDLVDLDFQKSLTWEQQLAASGEEPPGNASSPAERERRRKFWEKLWFYEALLGIGSGVILGILFGFGLCCLGRICRRRAAREMNRD